MRKKLAMMLLSLSVIANILILSVDNEPPKNLESYSMSAKDADPGY